MFTVRKAKHWSLFSLSLKCFFFVFVAHCRGMVGTVGPSLVLQSSVASGLPDSGQPQGTHLGRSGGDRHQ